MANYESKKYRFIRVSSKDAINDSDTVSNFHVDLSNDISLQQVNEIWFQGLSVPYSWYNIDAHNNVFIIQYGNSGVPSTYIIPPGFYNTTTLMAYLQNLINSDPLFAGNTISITQNPTTQLINFAITGTDTIIYFPSIPPVAPGNPPTGSTIAPYIGITALGGPTLNFTAQTLPDLAGDKYLFVNSKEILPNNTTISAGINASAFASVPLARFPFLSLIKYESWGSLIDRLAINTVSLNNIGFTLRGDDGRILPIAPNDEVILIFKVYYD